jgi:hypothetical protein
MNSRINHIITSYDRGVSNSLVVVEDCDDDDDDGQPFI